MIKFMSKGIVSYEGPLVKQGNFARLSRHPFREWSTINIFELAPEQIESMILVCTSCLHHPSRQREAESWLELLKFRYQTLLTEKQREPEERKKLKLTMVSLILSFIALIISTLLSVMKMQESVELETKLIEIENKLTKVVSSQGVQ